MTTHLPVLIAQLAVDGSAELLRAVAMLNRVAYVPLLVAPAKATLHRLEIHAPDLPEPLILLAEPQGAPSDLGFPLRLRTLDSLTPKIVAAPNRKGTPPLRPTEAARPTQAGTRSKLARHTAADLSGHDAEPVEDLAGKTVGAGKYQIERLLGEGAFGRVYLARHRELRRSVAVKVLHASFQRDPEYAVRFYGEALAASKLDHVNITRVLDYGQEANGLLYLVMEYLAGDTLAQQLANAGPFPLERLAGVMMQVCAGLLRAHEAGIIHRDVKPENILIVPERDDDGNPIEVVKICDFGIAQARALDAEGPEADATQNRIAGTPYYMSPEQCRGENLDARSDVYACGIIMYELATGRTPFESEDINTVLVMQVTEEPLPPSQIEPSLDPLLEQVILKALQKDRDHRQLSMPELRAELRELLEPLMVSRNPTAMPPLELELEVAMSTRGAADRAMAPASLRGGSYGEFLPVFTAGSKELVLETLDDAGASGLTLQHQALTPEALRNDPEGALRPFAATVDAQLFASLAVELERSMTAIARRGEVNALLRVVTELETLARATGDKTRRDVVLRALRSLNAPDLLGTIAKIVLVGMAGQKDVAKSLLLRAGTGGAHVLCATRASLKMEPAVRPRFVSVAREFGASATPAILGVLDHIQPGPGVNLDVALAEDLLRSLPDTLSEDAGGLISKFVGHDNAAVGRAAVGALVAAWGAKARPVFIGALDNASDGVRIAALGALRKTACVDELVVRRIDRMLSRELPVDDTVRAAGAAALADCGAPSRALAVSILERILAPPKSAGGMLARLRGGGPSEAPLVLVAASRALLALAPVDGERTIAECAQRSEGALRTQLRELLRR